MEMFTPSLDWGNELIASLLWVAKAWVISAVVHARCAGAARPVHHLGPPVLAHHRRRISRAARAFRCGCWLGVLLLSVMIDVRMDVLFSYYCNDQYSALQVAFEGAGAATTQCGTPASTASGSRS